MRYVMKQKFWSFKDQYLIKDAYGRDVLWVEGKVFSWGDQLIMRDSRRVPLRLGAAAERRPAGDQP